MATEELYRCSSVKTHASNRFIELRNCFEETTDYCDQWFLYDIEAVCQ